MTMRQNEIEQVVNRVLADFHITASPFSHIKQLCTHEEIIIKKAKFSPTVDGAFAVLKGDKYLFYNPSMPDGRQNFTKAHELGHYFLKHSLENGKIVCSPQNIFENERVGLPQIEKEANLFAVYFLMPEPMIRAEFFKVANIFIPNLNCPLYVDNQPCNLKYWKLLSRHLVSHFGVSKEALGYRLDNLGLIKYNF